jgi:hypothetical protein
VSRLFCLCALLCLCACQPAAPRWITLAEALQGRAPALYADAERVTAVWVGADAAGVHHDARQLRGDALTPVTVLPLPPTHPYDQRLYPASDGSLFLLWLDRGADDATTLYSAWIAPDLSVRRTTPVSDGLALRYAAVPDGQGGLWTAWSGGILSELTLYVRHLDAEGRPLDQARITANAEYPAMTRADDGTILLFWIQAGQVYRARLDEGRAVDGQGITSAVSLAPGDRLHDFSAALDATHAYVFWNITRAAGGIETWYAAGEMSAPFWTPPTRLIVSRDPVTPLRWVSPAAGQFETLRAAAESAAGLGIVELRGGQVSGYRITVPDVYLIGAPALVVRPDDTLVLAWSSPDAPRARLHLLP